MQKGFRIGKIFGINIRIDWSWILIFLLISWNLSAVFGGFNQDWSLALRWTVAISASLLFFISVLLHELAHSLVARARGLPVRSITLFLFGGVSNIEREPTSPGMEFWMAVVGPLTSIGLGLLLLFGVGALTTLPTIRFPTRAVGRYQITPAPTCTPSDSASARLSTPMSTKKSLKSMCGLSSCTCVSV